MNSHPEQPVPDPPPPLPPVPSQPVTGVDWFRRMPNGGATVYTRPTD
ncbi:hypothetical protein [Lentzea sp. NEAU-D7]|nr:hypothetical protein [Lentzea sp. NEAU-D7]MCX2951008.1 hypothetical protein [Lentzea sp. NEAU-D7]